jgi:hypothetical protein
MEFPQREVTMAEGYTDYQFRLEVRSPVAADSPFDSDTLWGRMLCSLVLGSKDERALATQWLSELSDRPIAWLPSLLVSEGFQCDGEGEPWLPLPLAVKRQIEGMKVHRQSGEEVPRKELKKIESVPLREFAKLCRERIGPEKALELLDVRHRAPCIRPALQPHIAMDRLSGTGLDGRFYMQALHIYLAQSPEEESRRTEVLPERLQEENPQPSQIIFFLRLRDPQYNAHIKAALERICNEGWGNGKSRGIGGIKFKEFRAQKPTWSVEPTEGFVSLSHFCPASIDPKQGYWKIQPKHPVPAQFVDGRRVLLGEEAKAKWRVRSFLRLRAGSCFQIPPGETPRGWYGRMLKDLVIPAHDASGQPLPPLYHYGLAFAVPFHLPVTEALNP